MGCVEGDDQARHVLWLAGAFNQPIGRWNTSKVMNMSFSFTGVYAFNQPLEEWDVSSVTNMGGMFCRTDNFNQLLSKWIVSSEANTHLTFNQPLV